DKSSSTMQMITFFLLKGGTIGCMRMAGRFAPLAFEDIKDAIYRGTVEAPALPVSCAAMLAEKMGATERQTVMASGLAGGIGLCGGACGALGTAIWLMAMKLQKETDIKNLWNDKAFTESFDNLIESFLVSSDYEFECADIIGRKFESVEDHAAFIRDGGCSKILETLAAVS
ncbi:C_GCAxxG_C_C family protein, partial [bacterium]|nr:C_GCAxxG_C_C family protein [bacterium]